MVVCVNRSNYGVVTNPHCSLVDKMGMPVVFSTLVVTDKYFQETLTFIVRNALKGRTCAHLTFYLCLLGIGQTMRRIVPSGVVLDEPPDDGAGVLHRDRMGAFASRKVACRSAG
jgi:hypothetical protein